MTKVSNDFVIKLEDYSDLDWSSDAESLRSLRLVLDTIGQEIEFEIASRNGGDKGDAAH